MKLLIFVVVVVKYLTFINIYFNLLGASRADKGSILGDRHPRAASVHRGF
jgi:hypothetical protein